jgi:parallel beta-helix repeat protein
VGVLSVSSGSDGQVPESNPDGQGMHFVTLTPAGVGALPVPAGTASVGQVPVVSVVSPLAMGWGAGGGAGGVTVTVPPPTGATATDTPAVVAAIASLTAALSFGPATLLFQDGVYQVDSNTFVVQSLSGFTVKSSGQAVISQAPNRVALPNNTTGDLCVIADCTRFSVENITFDCNRDVVSPLTPLSATAASGQPSVTVAAGNGARYVVGQRLSVYGGLGSADAAKSDGVAGLVFTVSAIAAGGGAGGGDLITFGASNLSATYTVISATAVSDGLGPYAYAGAYLSPYEPDGTHNAVAGRTNLLGEDQQNCLHLMNCQRFRISGVTARNTWSSQIKCGNGFCPTALADGCSQGIISNCAVYHGYDQGVSLWSCSDITVTGCVSNASGWGGVVTFSASGCTISDNVIVGPVYAVPDSNGNGNGIAIQGGSRNTVSGNVIDSPMQNGIYLMNQGPAVTGAPPAGVTLTAYLASQAAAGTSVQVSATAGFVTGSQLSILDGYRTEIVYIASIVDGTHLTFSNGTRFPHPSGCAVTFSIAEDTVVSGNSIFNAYGNGILNSAVRSLISGNTIVGSGLRNTAATSGIACNSSGGWGSVITGNQVGGGFGASMTLWSQDHLLVADNEISGPAIGTGYGIDIQAMADSVISGNRVSDVLAAGINVHGTGPGAVRTSFTGNLVTRCMGDGIGLNTATEGCTITGNTISSCYGTAGIDLTGAQYATISGNTISGCKNSGIQLNNSGAVFCLYNTISGNICRDDGSGVRVDTGAANVQQYGIRELGGSDFNVYSGNECDANSIGQLVLLGTHSRSTGNIISGAVIPAAVTTPGVVLTAVQNTTGHDVLAYVTGGTVTVIAVGAVTTGLTAGAVHVPAGQTITLTYSAAPTWQWIAAS